MHLDWRFCYFTVGCDPLNISDSGYANQSSDGSSTTAQFGCDVGASVDGETILTCLGDGVWDTAMPVCGKLF